MNIKTAIVMLITLGGFVLQSPALAQTQEELPAPPTPRWSAGQGYSATPEGACQLAHQGWNPGAPYSPATYVDENTYKCHWVASQQGGGPAANTILANSATGRCYPSSATAYRFQNGACVDIRTDAATGQCDPAQGPSSAPSAVVGNPVCITSGYKLHNEEDYATSDGLFTVRRHYTSSTYRLAPFPLPLAAFGEVWQGLIPAKLYIDDSDMRNIYYAAGNGSSQHQFKSPSDTSNWTYTSPVGSRARLTMVTVPGVSRPTYFAQPVVQNGPAEFKLAFGNGEYIMFRRSAVGTPGMHAVPIERGFVTGYKQFFDYPDTGIYPNKVRDSFGREMTLTWTNVPLSPQSSVADDRYRALSSILLPDGTTLNYEYENANWAVVAAYDDTGGVSTTNPVVGRKDRLISARRTDAASTLLWKRTYLYEDTRWPYALTGIKDQNDVRLSTYTYDQAGLVAASERAGGIDRYQFRQFRLNTNGTVNEGVVYRDVTNPLGRVQRFHLTRSTNIRPHNLPRALTKIEGFATSNVPMDVTTLEYQGSSLTPYVTATIDARGTRTNHVVDATNYRPTSVVEAHATPSVRTTTVTWHSTLDLPTREERAGLRVDYTYSSTGQLQTRTETDTTTHTVPYSTAGQARTWTYEWGTAGRLLSINGPKPVDGQGRDDTIAFTYDASGNLLSSTNGLGDVTTFGGHDVNGRPGTMTDPNGVVTAYTYDAFGRTKTVNAKHPTTSSLDAISSLDYDLEGRVIGITSPATEKLMIDYNIAGQLTAIRMASGERIDYQHDATGNRTAETAKRADASAARSIARTFDDLGRMLTETLGPSRTRTWAYDKNGNATQVTSARSNATQAAFDALNRLVSTVAPDTGTSALAYNAIDAMTSYTDAVSVQTTFVRNGFGDAIREVSPDRGTSTYHYNEAGELTASIDGRGQRVDYARDVLGRLISKTPVGRPTTETISHLWDSAGLTGSYGKGRLASVTDGTGTTSFAYDHRGNLITKQQAIGSSAGVSLSYVYDLTDRITHIVYPSGRVVEYIRDGKGRVSSVQTKASASDSIWTVLAGSITYEPWGSMKGAVFGNGLTMNQSWGNDGRLASKRLFNTATSADLSQLTYAYDNDDNITGITDGVDATKSVQYGYDNRGRLAQAIAASGSVKRLDYLFDKNGNRTAVEQRAEAADASPLATDTYAKISGTNRLASITNGANVRSITYDARGNSSTETRPGSLAVAATYDGHGRLLTYTRTGELSQANSYNGLDDRVSVTTSNGITSSTRYYVYDADGRHIGEYGASASDLIAETIWLQPQVANGNEPIGGGDGIGGYAPLAVVAGAGASAAIQWVHGNHLGVPIVTSDASGGAITPTGYTMPGFPGQTRTLSDLYYNRHRDYDSSIGRYVQADPIGLVGGANPYLYAEGNPLSYVDPDGQNPLLVGAVVGLAVGIGIDLGIQAASNWLRGRSLLDPDCYDWKAVAFSGAVGAVTGGAVAWRQPLSHAPDFIVSTRGTAFPVPKGAKGPTPVINPAGKKTGSQFTGGSGGQNGQVASVRIMDPTPINKTGYIKYENGAVPKVQGVDPYTGRTLGQKESHFPL